MDRVSSMLSFVKVVEQGGFSSAARQLNLATSVVTNHVKSLEDRLGARLLNRTTRNVSLTEIGREYYERCVQILSEIEDAEEAAHRLQSKPRGTLRLNTSPSVPLVIAPSMVEYCELYPEITIHHTSTSRMLDLVEEGYDLAIWYGAAPNTNLIIRRLASFALAVCASPGYLAKHGRPAHPSELSKHNFIIYYDSTLARGGKDWLFTGPDGDFSVSTTGTLETNSPTALRTAAVSGLALVVGPAPMFHEEFSTGKLVPILQEFLPNKFSIDALYPHREHLPTKVRTFIDLVAKNLRQIDLK